MLRKYLRRMLIVAGVLALGIGAYAVHRSHEARVAALEAKLGQLERDLARMSQLPVMPAATNFYQPFPTEPDHRARVRDLLWRPYGPSDQDRGVLILPNEDR